MVLDSSKRSGSNFYSKELGRMTGNTVHEVENMELLGEIIQLKKEMDKLYRQSGPNSSGYLDVSLRLNLLKTKYIDEIIENLAK